MFSYEILSITYRIQNMFKLPLKSIGKYIFMEIIDLDELTTIF